METVVDVTIPTDQFVLQETFDRVPEAEFEAVRAAVHSSERTMPYLWGSLSDHDRLDAALEADPTTESVTCLSRDDGRGLYLIDWTNRKREVIADFVEAAGSVLEVQGTADRWRFSVLFPDRATASETVESWYRDDLDPSICRINNLSCGDQTEMGLSSIQHTAIVEAFQTDYYEVPRGTTLEELATEFDVSHQALSERLRRGHSHLVEQMLTE